MSNTSIKSRFYFFVSSFFLLLAGLPYAVLVQAQDEVVPDPTILKEAGDNIIGGFQAFGGIVSSLTVIAVSFVFLYFFWNLAVYIKASGDDQKEEAKSKMGWSVLAIIVVTSLWGIIAFFRGVVGIGTGSEILEKDVKIPGVQIRRAKIDGQIPGE